ncbi:hypothetical protein [Natronococcus jeotgali]|uniref:Uncharacterized protein n=1 Tax=Natronococcus jeotgali DSM 18795 TaxID=1227498 RepID=L9X8N3_9EURY|nr:hypothetical protein [Natronococcus jeotgali]ELY57811.1 hypothetical protein C492_12854 [Natronococcus jeotgali DSM 18795]
MRTTGSRIERGTRSPPSTDERGERLGTGVRLEDDTLVVSSGRTDETLTPTDGTEARSGGVLTVLCRSDFDAGPLRAVESDYWKRNILTR